MKYLIASDIHGSAYYCRLLVNAITKEKPDKILLLGDILYHGPRNDLPREYAPKEVIAMLNPLKDITLSVRGNCDAEVDQMVLDFPIMQDYSIIEEGKVKIFATHGHIYNCDKLPPLNNGEVLLNGHTHIPKCERKENFIYMNCGSVSIPKENSCHSYMVFSNGEFLWKDLEKGRIFNKYILK